jgi:hypothetical protein
VNRAFRISPSSLRQGRLNPIFAILMVGGITGYAYTQGQKFTLFNVSGLITLAAVLAALAWWNRRKYLQWAEKHSLTVGHDAVIFHDGDVETRVPYSSITRLKVKRSGSTTRRAEMQHSNGLKDDLSGYEGLPELINSLKQKVPEDRVIER